MWPGLSQDGLWLPDKATQKWSNAQNEQTYCQPAVLVKRVVVGGKVEAVHGIPDQKTVVDLSNWVTKRHHGTPFLSHCKVSHSCMK